jgi:predicted RNase H-like nuclease
MLVVGVDGCRDGWIAVALANGRFAGAATFPRFEALLNALDDAYVVGVDMPLGLVERGLRRCDLMLRERLGPRRSSLFVVPPRPALSLDNYDEANEATRELAGQGLTKQAYNLRDKIFELEAAVRADEERKRTLGPYFSSRERMMLEEQTRPLRNHARIIETEAGRKRRLAAARPAGRIIEVHPEASFAVLAGQPLSHKKKSYNGAMMRLRLLERAGIEIPLELDTVGGVAVDDVLDAAVVAWTAHRYGMQQAISVPPRDEWQRDGDRVIAIWT